MDAVAEDVLAERMPAEAGEGATPRLELDGFSGPLDLLLSLARAREVDLARLSVVNLVDQLALAFEQADPAIPLSQKADWVVMASWLLLLRSRLALPADAPAREDAADDAEALRGQLIELRAAQALAHWLDRRPQLGRDAFARGRPELLGTSIDTRYEVDVIEFLWACLAQFEDDLAGDGTDTIYRPRRPDLCSVLEARARMERSLADMLETAPFACFLPRVPGRGRVPSDIPLWRRSAVASTLMAGLELAREGVLLLEQPEPFATITLYVRPGGMQDQLSQAAG
jgi:segregation and condensation protein A